jgi:hypothetical protein
MSKTILLIILILTTASSCRSNQKTTFKEKIDKTIEIKKDSIFKSVLKDSVIKKTVKEEKIKEQVSKNDGKVIIKGTSDSLKDFHFHNVVDGDTLSDIFISGNAVFVIKNKWKKENVSRETFSVKEDFIIAMKVLKKEIGLEKVEKINSKIVKAESEIKAKGFGIAVYIISGVILLVVIILLILIKKFKK